MKKRTLLPCLLILGALPAVAAPWEKAADLSLNVSQAAYSDSWTGGETGSVTWTFVGNVLAEKALSPNFNWRNTLKLTYGQTHRQDKDASGSFWVSPEKSSDRIFFESLLRMTLGKFADPYTALTFESQFYDASVPQVKRYVNPKTISEAAGVGRTLVKNDDAELISRVGFSVRQHISKNVISVDPEETKTETTSDGGLEWVTDYSHTFGGEALKYVSKLRAFKAFFNSESDDLKGLPNEDYWKTPDLAWENTLSASVSKYIQVSLFCELLYDKEVDLRGRFREILSLGLTYKLF